MTGARLPDAPASPPDPMSPHDQRERFSWAIWLADALAALCLAIGLGVLIAGGIPRFELVGIRVSLSTPARAWFVAALILALRHWRDPRHPRLHTLVRRFSPGTDMGERQLFPPPRSTPAASILELLLVAAGFATLVAIITLPQITRLGPVPDFGDPLFSTWRLSWIAHQLRVDPWHLFNGNTFYPERLTLTYSDPMLVPALVAAPFIWYGVHQLVVYNLLFLSGMAASGTTMFYLVRALTGRRDAAAIAGTMFAIYPYRFEHYSHLELQMTLWMPLALLCLHRTIARGRLRDGLLTGLFVALQALSSLYYGVFLVTFMIPVGATLWMVKHRGLPPLRALAAGGVLAAVLLAPVGAAYLANRSMLGERSVDEIESYSAVASDFFRPHFRSATYGELPIDGRPERHLFPGLLPLALAVVALWPPLSVSRMGYALGLAVAFDGALGLHGVLYPWLHDYGIVFRGLRVPARFSILVGFTFAVLAGFAVTRLVERWPRWRSLLVPMLFATAVLDARPHLELRQVWMRPPRIYRSIPEAERPVVLAEFPNGADNDFPYVYFSTFHWQKLLNGNSGFFPPSYEEFIEETRGFPDAASLAYLRQRGVQYVAVHGGFLHPPRSFSQIANLIAATPALEPIASAPFEGSVSTLYRLRP